MAKIIPYRPANGTEGLLFYDAWCLRCQRDESYRQDQNSGDPCDILTRSFAFAIDDPDYPVEWIEDDVEWPTPSNPRCTAFLEIETEGSTYTLDPRQLEIPGLGDG